MLPDVGYRCGLATVVLRKSVEIRLTRRFPRLLRYCTKNPREETKTLRSIEHSVYVINPTLLGGIEGSARTLANAPN